MRDMVEQSANEISWMDNTGCTVDKRERAEGEQQAKIFEKTLIVLFRPARVM